MWQLCWCCKSGSPKAPREPSMKLCSAGAGIPSWHSPLHPQFTRHQILLIWNHFKTPPHQPLHLTASSGRATPRGTSQNLGKYLGGFSSSFPPREEGFRASPLAHMLTEGEAVGRTKKTKFLHNSSLLNSALLAEIMNTLQINLPWFQLWTFSVPAKLPCAGGTSAAVTNSQDPRCPFYNGLVLNQTAALS